MRATKNQKKVQIFSLLLVVSQAFSFPLYSAEPVATEDSTETLVAVTSVQSPSQTQTQSQPQEQTQTTNEWMSEGALSESNVEIINPGDEAAISTALNNGHNVALVAGQTYYLSASEQIKITASQVELNGNGAILHLDNTFNNYFYNPLELHGDVHGGSPAPINNGFGMYVGYASGVTIRNLKIERDAVSGSVVRSIGIVKSSGVKIQNVEMTGNTLGAIIDIVDSDRVTVVDCYIHDSVAEDQAQKLNLASAGKPNLTGILIDDVDLLSGLNRKDGSLHSHDVLILNNQIKNLSMHPSVFDAMKRQLGITDTSQQTDGINVQRGFDYKILNNTIGYVDEGVDTFGYRGLIKDNYFVATRNALKFIHGASHNLVTGNQIINADISSILAASTATTLTGSQGPFGNVLFQNTSSGSGKKLHLIWRAPNAPGPNMNFMLKNAGGTNSSNFTSNDPNIYFTTSSAEPDKVLFGDFDRDGQSDDLALYFKGAGRTDIYLRTASQGFDGYKIDTLANAICNNRPGCLDHNKNMSHVFTGRFFAEQPNQGDIEFLFLNTSGSNIMDRFQKNNGDGTFRQYSQELDSEPIPSTYKNIVVGDFNGDGKTDVFFHSAADGQTRLYRNDDVATTPDKLDFTRLDNVMPAEQIKDETDNPIVAMKTGDFNGDGKTDLFFLWKTGKTQIYTGMNNGTFAAGQSLTTNLGDINNMSNPDDIRVYDYNQDGYDDVLFLVSSDTRRLFQWNPTPPPVGNPEPDVPEGWTQTRSNPNYALQIETTSTVKNLKLLDLRTNQTYPVDQISSAEDFRTIDVSPDNFPGGPVVAYEVTTPREGGGFDSNTTVQRVSDPTKRVTVSGRGVDNEPREIRFDGNRALAVHESDFGGVIFEDTWTITGTSESLRNDGFTAKILEGISRLHVDGDTPLVIQPVAHFSHPDEFSFYIYDASGGIDRLRLLREVRIILDSGGDYTFFDAYTLPSGRQIVSVGLDADHSNTTVIIDPKTGEELRLEGAATSVTYEGSFATYTVVSQEGITSKVKVDLETLKVVPIVPSVVTDALLKFYGPALLPSGASLSWQAVQDASGNVIRWEITIRLNNSTTPGVVQNQFLILTRVAGQFRITQTQDRDYTHRIITQASFSYDRGGNLLSITRSDGAGRLLYTIYRYSTFYLIVTRTGKTKIIRDLSIPYDALIKSD